MVRITKKRKLSYGIYYRERILQGTRNIIYSMFRESLYEMVT